MTSQVAASVKPTAQTTHPIEDTEPTGLAGDTKDKASDLEEMLKPLPFFDELPGTCAVCQERPSAHAFWCELHPMNQN